MSQRPKMCPSCGKLVGLDRVCPYCGKDTGSVAARVGRLGRAGRGGHAVTIGLVVANLLVYLLIIAVGGQEPAEGGLEILVPDRLTLVRLGLQVPPLVSEYGEWWRIVMPIFLHLGLLHLVMNTLVLWVTGRHLEADIGGTAFFFMYITAGVVGFVASQFAGIGGGGASGAVAGVLGATIVKRRLSDGHFRDPVTQQAIQLVVLNALFGLFVSKVNNVAHLGGLLTGAGLGVALALWQGRAFARKLWLAGAAIAAAVVLAAVVAMLRWEAPPGLFDPSSRDVRARAVMSCARDVAMALDQGASTIAPEVAERAIQCINEVGPVEPELDRAMATLRDGLRRAADGRRGGSLAGEREGLVRIGEGLDLAIKWWRTHQESPR